MSRKPQVWRGRSFLADEGGPRMVACPLDAERENCIVVEYGAVMPLDAATERLVEAVRMILSEWPENRDGMDWRGPIPYGVKSARNALAAFDAARKGNQ